MSTENTSKKQYIREDNFASFSGMGTCEKCPHKYRVLYEGLEINGQIEFPERTSSHQLVIGQIAHTLIQTYIQEGWKIPAYEYCLEHLNSTERGLLDDPTIAREVLDAYNSLVSQTLPAVQKYIVDGDLELVSVEAPLRTKLNLGYFEENPIKEGRVDSFKGSIDLVLRSRKDDKLVLVDIKCSGFKYMQDIKTNAWYQYQLVYYKYFYSLQTGVPLERLRQEFWFVLKPKFKFEPFFFTAESRKVKNALEKMAKIISQINSRRFPQRKTACQYCDLRHTKFCP